MHPKTHSGLWSNQYGHPSGVHALISKKVDFQPNRKANNHIPKLAFGIVTINKSDANTTKTRKSSANEQIF